MRAETLWVVVADGARAQIFTHDGHGTGLKPRDFEGMNGTTAQTRELRTDAPGTYSGSASFTGRHALDPETDRHEYEEFSFIREVARTINSAAAQQEFKKLVVIAAPKALGNLRGEMSETAKRMVVTEISKDLIHATIKEIESHVQEHVRL